jgi:hypothetical protein
LKTFGQGIIARAIILEGVTILVEVGSMLMEYFSGTPFRVRILFDANSGGVAPQARGSPPGYVLRPLCGRDVPIRGSDENDPVRIGQQQAPGLIDLFTSNLESLQNKSFGGGRTKIEGSRR